MNIHHLAVGKFNIDVVVRLENIPNVDESLTTEILDIFPGGAATNYAVAVNSFGHYAGLLAVVSKEDLTKTLLKKVASKGVILDYLDERDVPQTSSLVILRKDGSISIVRKNIGSPLLTPDIIMDKIDIFDVVHFASVHPNLVMRGRRGSLVTYDPGSSFAEVSGQVDVDILYMNEAEYSKIKGGLKGPRAVVIKRGKMGAIYKAEGVECSVEALKVEKVIDTTGAGDVFDAALNYSMSSGTGLEESLVFASVASGLKVTRLGPSNAPSLQEVKEVIEKNPPRVVCK